MLPVPQVNLVDWLKRMVAERRVVEVLDPRLPEDPPSKALKRVVLAALRCVDPDAGQRPTMAHVVHMLEDQQIPRDVRVPFFFAVYFVLSTVSKFPFCMSMAFWDDAVDCDHLQEIKLARDLSPQASDISYDDR
jgi:hypothetical protein